MNITPITSSIPVPAQPVVQEQTDQAKEQKLAEAQAANKQSVVYFSPVIRIDRSTNTAIFQYRDRESGEVTREFPSKAEIDAYTPKKSPEPTDSEDEEKHIKEDA